MRRSPNVRPLSHLHLRRFNRRHQAKYRVRPSADEGCHFVSPRHTGRQGCHQVPLTFSGFAYQTDTVQNSRNCRLGCQRFEGCGRHRDRCGGARRPYKDLHETGCTLVSLVRAPVFDSVLLISNAEDNKENTANNSGRGWWGALVATADPGSWWGCACFLPFSHRCTTSA